MAITKILIIEDSPEIQELLKAILELKDFTVFQAYNSQEGFSLAQQEKPDLIILDLTLPDGDGIELCHKFKSEFFSATIPIIMLTARTSVIDRIKGLEIGANDYLIKPFDTLELIARIKVQLRDKEKEVDSTRISIKLAEVEIIPSTYQLKINEEQIQDITPREFDILYILMKNSPNPVSREEIFQEVGKHYEKGQSRVVDIHIAKIRKKIGEDRIKTISGKGYFFSA